MIISLGLMIFTGSDDGNNKEILQSGRGSGAPFSVRHTPAFLDIDAAALQSHFKSFHNQRGWIHLVSDKTVKKTDTFYQEPPFLKKKKKKKEGFSLLIFNLSDYLEVPENCLRTCPRHKGLCFYKALRQQFAQS